MHFIGFIIFVVCVTFTLNYCIPILSLVKSLNNFISFVQTTNSKLIFYTVNVDDKTRQVYVQNDSQTPGLRRDSAELYTKEQIPPLLVSQVSRIIKVAS